MPYEGHVDVVGACCFREREWIDAKAWALQWVWLHPYARRQGVLASAWPHFRRRYGDFHVEGPLSPAMKGFLARMGEHDEAWPITTAVQQAP